MTSPTPSLSKQAFAEFTGTALLLCIIVGSGIMAERLAMGNTALALLANSIATGTGLAVIIIMFAPISGAHFNPLVTLLQAYRQLIPWRRVPVYVITQLIGAVVGVIWTHLMFDEGILTLSNHHRCGYGIWLSEIIATIGLIGVIISCSENRPDATPFMVALYITSAYWFTSSTSFANPVVTLARSLTPTFTGIALTDTLGFILAQLVGLLIATVLFTWLYPTYSAKKLSHKDLS